MGAETTISTWDVMVYLTVALTIWTVGTLALYAAWGVGQACYQAARDIREYYRTHPEAEPPDVRFMGLILFGMRREKPW